MANSVLVKGKTVQVFTWSIMSVTIHAVIKSPSHVQMAATFINVWFSIPIRWLACILSMYLPEEKNNHCLLFYFNAYQENELVTRMNWASKIKIHGFFKKSRNRFKEKGCYINPIQVILRILYPSI